MKERFPEIQFIASPVFELLAAMFRVHSHEHLVSGRSGKLPEEDAARLNRWVEQKRAALPPSIREELELFFNPESFFGLTLIRYAWEHGVYDRIETFVDSLRELPSEELFRCFMKTGYAPVGLLAGPPDVQAYIEQSNLPEQEKWKAAYLHLYSEKTKSRLVRLLQQFHAFVEDDLDNSREKQEASINGLKTFAAQHGERDFLELLSSRVQTLAIGGKKLVLAPSVFYDDCSLTSESDDSLILLYGTSQLLLQAASSPDPDKTILAFKILADEKRLGIVRMLRQGPLYGYELAQRLDLSNSTISHHLSALTSAGIVKATRKENRVYFEVQAEEIQKLFREMEHLLIGGA